MSYPGANWQQQHPQQQQQYGGPPPQQYPPQQYPPPQYGAPPPGPGYGYGAPPPPQQQQQQYGGYPPPQQQGYGAPPLPNRYGPPSPQPGYGAPPPQQRYGPPSPQPPYNSGHSPRPGYGPPPPSAGGWQQPPPQGFAGTPGYGRPPPPPSQSQGFGHGAPQGYQYQYSQCNGKRKALIIGINYFGTSGKLAGCINDANNVAAFLSQRYNYERDDMVILTDDQRNPMSIPTRANMIRAMHWLVKDARPNDSLFFHFSGHGGQTKDLDGDEEDGYDEVVYPVDFKQAGHIVDDDLHSIMVKPLLPGVRLTAIFDSCHSGSCLDLPFIYSTQGVLKEPNLAKEAGQGLLGMVSSYAKGDIGGMASTAMGLFKKIATGDDVDKKNKQTKTSPADVIMWSGSKDSQTSADANINSQATGAMSYAFINALKKNPQQSYVQLLNSIRDELEGKYSQKPQLSCSHPLDTNVLFVM